WLAARTLPGDGVNWRTRGMTTPPGSARHPHVGTWLGRGRATPWEREHLARPRRRLRQTARTVDAHTLGSRYVVPGAGAPVRARCSRSQDDRQEVAEIKRGQDDDSIQGRDRWHRGDRRRAHAGAHGTGRSDAG